MRGPISEVEPGTLGVSSALCQAIPAVYQEDPLFMLLCAAFDDLMAPLVTAVDCFDAYLDPYLAPADFLPWLAALVGYQGPVRQGTSDERARIASAARDHTRRGTALGVREAAARAAGVPLEQVELDDPGGTRWSTVPGAASSGWRQALPQQSENASTDANANTDADRNESKSANTHVGATVRVSALVPSGAQRDSRKVVAAVRAAIEETAGVHCGIAVELVAVAAVEAARPSRARPSGARIYGGESES
jgi:phage tail-like protein